MTLPPECEQYLQQYDCFLKHVAFSQNDGESFTPDQLTEMLRTTYTHGASSWAGWASVQQTCVKTQASLASAIEQAGCTDPATAPPPKPQVAPAPASTIMQIGGECQFGDDCDSMVGAGFCDNDDSPGHCELACKTDCDCPSDRHCGPYQHPGVSGGRKA